MESLPLGPEMLPQLVVVVAAIVIGSTSSCRNCIIMLISAHYVLAAFSYNGVVSVFGQLAVP